MLFKRPLCLLLLCVSPSFALNKEAGERCFGACQLALDFVTFNDTNSQDPNFGRLCGSKLRIKSIFLCVGLYCQTQNAEMGLHEWNETCQRYENVTLPPLQLVTNYTNDDVEQLRRIRREEIDGIVKSGEIVLPDERLFGLSFKTLNIADYETGIHALYGWSMYYFWIVVIAMGLCVHVTSLITEIRRRDWMPQRDNQYYHHGQSFAKNNHSAFCSIHNLLQRYLIVPATFGYHCSQNVGWCTIPPRIQSLTIAAFIFINVVLCSVNYYAFPENLYWPNISTQLWRYISDRTGLIAFANFPLIWLFGMRNNVLMWLTGWGFGTYNSFHRWIARIATVEATVHSIGYTILVLENDDWPLYWKYWTERFWWMGELATISMVLVCVCSVYGLRRSYYEVFLGIHILISFIVLVTMWYHIEIFKGSYDHFVWPCLAIWLFDRLMRVCRILSFNPKFWSTKGLATYATDANIVRLVIPCSTSLVKPKPGAYYYLYILNSFYVWESHPFTLAYSTTEESISAAVSTTRLLRSPSSQSISPEFETLLPTALENTADLKTSTMTFLIRPYSSFTSRLRSSSLIYPSCPRVLVEGPYGSPPPLHKFNSILFLVGGTGIAVPLSYLSSLAESTLTTSITIIWAVRELAFLEDTIDTDFRLPRDTGMEKVIMKAYVTRDGKSVDKTDESDNEEEGHPLRLLGTSKSRIFVKSGRPDIKNEIDDSVEEVGYGSLAVVACGPGQLADEARRAVVSVLNRDVGSVEYYEESFKW